MEECHIIFKGRVQGIGFRWTVVEHAKAHGILGTVQNLTNGDVEAIAQGPRSNLEFFLRAIQQDPGLARITALKTTYRPINQTHSSFGIL